MNVVKLNDDSTAINPDVVLEEAKGEYSEVFILGYDNDGALDVRSSTNWDVKSILFAIEQFKNKMLNGDYRG